MRSYLTLGLLLSVLCLTACTSPEYLAKKAARNSLIGSDIMGFGEFTLVDEKFACLVVNERNALEGHPETLQSLLEVNGNRYHVIGNLTTVNHDHCVDVAYTLARR